MTADDTTPAVIHVEPVYEPWDVAVDAVCSALETYTGWRHLSGDVARCAQLAGVSPTTAARFERTLREVEAPIDVPTATNAAPDRPGPGAAEQPAPTQ